MRGYDIAAVSGAQGTLAIIEYRHDFTFALMPGPWQASVFADSGRVQACKIPYFSGPNRARLNSIGLGLHWVAMHDWVLSTSVAKAIGNWPRLVGAYYSSAARFWFQVQKGFY